MLRKIILLSIILKANPGFAINYYQSASNGKIKKISAKQFDQCSNFLYRKSGKKELSNTHKKALLKALITGKAINSLDVAKDTLKSNPGTCSYGTSDEKFM